MDASAAAAGPESARSVSSELEPTDGRRPGRELAVQDPDLGASTVEYAIILLAAAAFGGVMAAVINSDGVSSLLLKIVEKALAI